MVSTVYPEIRWLPWKFKRSPNSASFDKDLYLEAIEFVENELKLEKAEDWSRVSRQQLKELGIDLLASSRAKLAQSLELKYPSFDKSILKG
jgi:hypothetical protein